MRSQLPPQKGDVVQVSWVDIYEDCNGDPDKAKLAKRVSIGLFWAFSEDDGVQTLVTTTTIEAHDKSTADSGYCVYPMACVKKLKVLRRSRRKA